MRRPSLTRVLYPFYASGERLSHALRRRVTEVGWFMLAATFVIGLSGIDTRWSLHHQIFALMLMSILVAGLGLLARWKPKLQVRRQCPRFATAGLPLRYAVLVTHQGRRGRAHDLRLAEWLPTQLPTREEFINRREPREKERNLFDRTFVYYRWMWLLEGRRLAQGCHSEAFSIGAGETLRLMMTLLPQRRGLLPLRSLRALKRDPLGLFQRAFRTLDTHSTLLILPRRYPIGNLNLSGRRQLDEPGIGATSVSMAVSDEFVGLREYRPGDPPRHIHWRSWARLGRPVVKEFEEEHFPRFALALDTALAPGSDPECFEEAVSVAASFVTGVETRDAWLECLFVTGRIYRFSMGGPGASRAEEKLLEVLAMVQPTSATDALDHLEGAILSRASSLSAVVLVFPEWSERRQQLMTSLRARGMQCVALVVSAESQAHRPGVHFLPLGSVGPALAALEIALPDLSMKGSRS